MTQPGGGIGRREFLGMAAGGVAAAALARYALAGEAAGVAPQRPNIVLILTDDQGYGDLSCHGNTKLRTPNIDRLAAESVELTQFRVSPVCAPTRASLMTGRYHFRTGAIDTYLGRAMMHPDEVTLAEMLRQAGYHTGLFGKWHLGDNYPMRPGDQGFDETLYHLGGGIGQPSDLPGGSRYTDPVLMHNGRPEKRTGYCMDIYTQAAMKFIESPPTGAWAGDAEPRSSSGLRQRPFFVYLATNTPHMPLEIDEKYVAPYRAMGLPEATAKTYGMIANIDENVGRLLAKLKELNLEKDTIVIFMTDNGAADKARFSAGLRDGKGTVYDGGIRVPCFIRWPGKLQPRKMDRLAAHIDVVPTLLAACNVPPPKDVKLDGLNLLPLLDGRAGDWPARTLFYQWHRGDEPVLFRNAAAVSGRYKLVMRGEGARPKVELYDVLADPGETKDLAAGNPDVVAKLRAEYEAWFKDVTSTRGFAPPRIQLGTRVEPATTLSRQDWRGPQAGWGPDSLGYWEVEVPQVVLVEVKLRFKPAETPREAQFKLGKVALKKTVDKGADVCAFSNVTLEAGPGRLEAWLEAAGAKPVGVNYVDVRRVD